MKKAKMFGMDMKKAKKPKVKKMKKMKAPKKEY